MPACLMLVPFTDGYAHFPGVENPTPNNGDGVISGVPPDPKYPQYQAVWLKTTQKIIDQLKLDKYCLYLVGMNELREFTADTALTKTDKTAIVDKLKVMGYDKELIIAIAEMVTKATAGSDVALALLMNVFGMASADIEYRSFGDGSAVKVPVAVAVAVPVEIKV